MNKQKTENKKVRKFLKRLGLGLLMLTAIAVIYIGTSEPSESINSAADQAQDMRLDLETKIDERMVEVDEWINLLKDKEEELSVDHSERIETLKSIQVQLMSQRKKLSDSDVSIGLLEERVDELIKNLENETQSITFTQTVGLDS